ncbi:Activating signal cointegrator 1 complex subunit 2 [Paragonimus heterotremus]|uniref:Activating signal cointegrator 1 complex subunit 2 n=1 Tax=Paragonimus heterotremus TaxID=100268 RepID=A0A8J4TDI0_9TREM|nr:Activating signal cointegrator 1 complex subunit 2 [Paragonimus heterotremus]
MLDLCALYYGLAPQQLINILSNVFSFQEKYFVDLESMLQVLFDSKLTDLSHSAYICFTQICDRIERELAVSFSGADRFCDLTAYLADISWSLYTFLIALSKMTTSRAINVCFNSGLLERLASFFENSFVRLQHELDSDLHLTAEQRLSFLSKLSDAGSLLLEAVRKGLVEPCLLNRIIQSHTTHSAGPSTSQSQPDQTSVTVAQQYVELLLQLLNCRNFSLAMQILYPVEQDMDAIRRAIGTDSLDDAAVQYVVDAAKCLLTEAELKSEDLKFVNSETTASTTPVPVSVPVEPVPGPSISGAVREVKEVLSHMDVDLIQRCLLQFNNDPSLVINAFLEGTIPDHVMHPDTQPRKPKTNRHSSVDDIELDLATAAATGMVVLDETRLWQGKRNSFSSENSLPKLGKREKRVTLRSAVSIWEDDEEVTSGEEAKKAAEQADARTRSQEAGRMFVDAYEDEYDDTFDVHVGAVDDLDSSDESTSSDKDRGNLPQSTQQPVLRIENPELFRQRQQHYQQSRRAHRRGRFDRTNIRPIEVPPQPLPPDEDYAVAGLSNSFQHRVTVSHHHKKLSGTGDQHIQRPNDNKSTVDGERKQETSPDQTKTLVANERYFKDVNKSRFANHNRRRLADRKRHL